MQICSKPPLQVSSWNENLKKRKPVEPLSIRNLAGDGIPGRLCTNVNGAASQETWEHSLSGQRKSTPGIHLPLWGRKDPEVPTGLSVECQLATEGENKQERKGFWASCGADIKWASSPHAVTCRRTTQQEGLLGPDQVTVFIRRCPQNSGKLAEELLSRPRWWHPPQDQSEVRISLLPPLYVLWAHVNTRVSPRPQSGEKVKAELWKTEHLLGIKLFDLYHP